MSSSDHEGGIQLSSEGWIVVDPFEMKTASAEFQKLYSDIFGCLYTSGDAYKDATWYARDPNLPAGHRKQHEQKIEQFNKGVMLLRLKGLV